MEVTSNQLELGSIEDGMDEDGDELSKRPDNFGMPVGKSEVVSFHIRLQSDSC